MLRMLPKTAKAGGRCLGHVCLHKQVGNDMNAEIPYRHNRRHVIRAAKLEQTELCYLKEIPFCVTVGTLLSTKNIAKLPFMKPATSPLFEMKKNLFGCETQTWFVIKCAKVLIKISGWCLSDAHKLVWKSFLATLCIVLTVDIITFWTCLFAVAIAAQLSWFSFFCNGFPIEIIQFEMCMLIWNNWKLSDLDSKNSVVTNPPPRTGEF